VSCRRSGVRTALCRESAKGVAMIGFKAGVSATAEIFEAFDAMVLLQAGGRVSTTRLHCENTTLIGSADDRTSFPLHQPDRHLLACR
jgi:hypothetical protein